MTEVRRDCVERIMVAIAAGENNNAEFHRIVRLLSCGSGGGGDGGSLFTRGPTLLSRRLTIAFLQVRYHNAQHELLFAMLIEFDDDVLFGAGNNGTKAKLGV